MLGLVSVQLSLHAWYSAVAVLRNFRLFYAGVVGWCDGAGYTFSAGAILMTIGQGPIALSVGADGGGLDIFTLVYPFSPFSLSLGDGSIYTEILSQRAVRP